MRPRWRADRAGPGALALAVALAAVDTSASKRERFDAADFALELLEWAGIVGAWRRSRWVTLALRAMRADQAAMRHDLARAVEQGADWRARARRGAR